ncbi:bifunctional riboflavin kinase/FAD synthetase [Candidatus Cloacimonadota bacterium]
MTFFKGQKCSFNKPVIAMGTFDGVHLGHQKLLKILIDRAREIAGEAIVISYYHHPLETIHKKTFPYLLTEKDTKEKLLKDLGVDCVLYLNFDQKIAEMEPRLFLEKIIIGEINAREVIVGYDTHFGKDRRGDHKFLQSAESEFGYKIELVPPLKIDNRIVSSSIIRDYIREGNMQEANRLLGRDYSIIGIVQTGHKIGRDLGYPTINILPADKNKLIPALGVYMCLVDVSGSKYFGVTNVGYSPTLKTTGILEVETHIIDFSGDIYGKEVEVFFCRKLRDELYFESKDELIKRIGIDVEAARKYFGIKEK